MDIVNSVDGVCEVFDMFGILLFYLDFVLVV